MLDSRWGLLRGRSRRRLLLILIIVGSALFLLSLNHPVGQVLYNSYLGDGSHGPPTYTLLRQWERDLPQHNLDLPYPEGRHGRYVKFSSQIKELGWNNVLNEV